MTNPKTNTEDVKEKDVQETSAKEDFVAHLAKLANRLDGANEATSLEVKIEAIHKLTQDVVAVAREARSVVDSLTDLFDGVRKQAEVVQSRLGDVSDVDHRVYCRVRAGDDHTGEPFLQIVGK